MKKFPFVSVRTSRPSFLILISMFCLSSLSQASLYDVIDLGSLSDGGKSWAYSINDSGVVVGRAEDDSGNYIACRFNTDGSVNNLGTLTGYTSSYAYAINNDGAIVGWSQNSTTDRRACTFTAGVSPASLSDNTNSMAVAINNTGTTVGRSGRDAGETEAYNFTNTGFLGGDNSWALSINSTGTIVGSEQNGSGTDIACKFSDTGNIPLYDKRSWAYSINDGGQIVGSADNENGFYNACIFNSDGSGINTDFGTLGGNYSLAIANNNLGQIVGYAENASGAARACLFESSTAIDLNILIDPSSGWSLRYAYDINNDGQIVGVGIRNGVERAFLLKVVPEPATVIILALGMSLLPATKKK
ncbi:MAG: hypothetical protein A2Y10_02900 [Planctomycetes bacterium GWF2_41_51]|nr:MAG: hypothetical protein A2Y10_02900 [Planctomycetes bacterium GWF2_41_51]HBG27499.1 hypothetical protein [Phycisphaerales bacterium]